MQDKKVESFVNELVERYPRLIVVKKEIEDGYEVLKNSYQSGGKLLIAGNGGSCADSEHIVGELMKGFCLARKVPDVQVLLLLRSAACAAFPVLQSLFLFLLYLFLNRFYSEWASSNFGFFTSFRITSSTALLIFSSLHCLRYPHL